MKRSIAVALISTGCALATGVPLAPPLESEGELFVELAPGSAGLPSIDAEFAVRADGTETPLRRARVAFAEGRLEPGAYRGLSLRVHGVDGATPIDAQFVVERRRAVVLRLEVRPGPSFIASIPPRTLPTVLGLSTAGAASDLRLFDKRSREPTGALPTGRAPWGIALDPLRSRAYVALSGEDIVAVVDLRSGEEIGRIRLGAGDEPREVALAPDGRQVVSANFGSGTVSLLDTDTLIEVARVPAGEAPQSILLDRSGRRAFIFSGRASTVAVLDLPSRATVGTLSLEAAPLRGQIDRAGTRLYVASSTSPFLSIFSLPDLSLKARVFVGLGVSALKVDPDTDLLYVAQGSRLCVYDPFSLIPVDYIDAGGAVSYAAIDASENALFLLEPGREAIAAIDLVTRKRLADFDAGAGAHVLALMGERF
jgi:YVTN family beta-propeller protein